MTKERLTKLIAIIAASDIYEDEHAKLLAAGFTPAEIDSYMDLDANQCDRSLNQKNNWQLVQALKEELGPELTDIEICTWLAANEIGTDRWVDIAMLFNFDPHSNRIPYVMSVLQSRGYDFDVHMDNWLAGCYPTVDALVEDLSIAEVKLMMTELAKS